MIMAIADTAESAVADDEHLASLAMFIKVSALVGDRGFKFEYGGLKVSVFPASKVNSPPDKGSWRRSGAAPGVRVRVRVRVFCCAQCAGRAQARRPTG